MQKLQSAARVRRESWGKNMKFNLRMMWAAAGMSATALFSFENANAEGAAILEGRAPQATALQEFEQLICPFEGEGGMLTAIVNAALSHGGAGEDISVRIAETTDRAELISMRGVTFPWYKPRCDRPSHLTEHTRWLCEQAEWSEPIFEMFVGYFTRADYERPLTSSWHLMGATICASGSEFPNLLRERGVSESNARIIIKPLPDACLESVVAGEADVAILPDSVADEALRENGMMDAIIRQPALDEVVTLHAIAQKGDAAGAATLAMLNRGMDEIRRSGEWFEIVARHLANHPHDGGYRHESHRHDEGAEEFTARLD